MFGDVAVGDIVSKQRRHMHCSHCGHKEANQKDSTFGMFTFTVIPLDVPDSMHYHHIWVEHALAHML